LVESSPTSELVLFEIELWKGRSVDNPRVDKSEQLKKTSFPTKAELVVKLREASVRVATEGREGR
jgi:hypothetical protein